MSSPAFAPAVDQSPLVDPRSVQQVLTDLRRLDATLLDEDWRSREDWKDREAWAQTLWAHFPTDRWPALFQVLTLAADLPRLAGNATLEALPKTVWPALSEVSDDLIRAQTLIDAPVLPTDTEWRPAVSVASALDVATTELRESHCVTVEDLFDAEKRQELDREIARQWEERPGSWGQLTSEEAPDLHALFGALVASPRFQHLTGFDADRDPFTLTLSLQDLQPAGIGWHRDLYWPKEWVGQDVFAVLYALGDDDSAKGGAFAYYVPWQNALRAVYRRRHQATVLWNAAATEGRLLHAVSGYNGADTSRHLVILQCLRSAS